MICPPCREAADHRQNDHNGCEGCDCQHQTESLVRGTSRGRTAGHAPAQPHP